MVLNTEPKPINTDKIERAKSKYIEFKPADYVPFIEPPEEVTVSVLSQLGKSAPYFILAYGRNILELGLEYIPLPPVVSTIIKWTAKGLGYAAKRYSVKEKELVKK